MICKKAFSALTALTVALTFSLAGASFALAEETPALQGRTSLAPKAAITAKAAFGTKALTAKTNYPVVPAGSTTSLKEGNPVIINHGTSDNVCNTWFRIKPKHSGYIEVSESASGRVTLCSASKRPLSDAIYTNVYASSKSDQSVFFGVKAGSTYYLKVRSSGSYKEESGYYLNDVDYESYAFTGKYGKSSSKAAKLSRGKLRKGYIVPNGKAKYYKFTKRGKTVKIYLAGCTDKQLKMSVTAKAKGFRTYKTSTSVHRYDNNQSTRVLTLTTRGKTRTMSVKVKVDGVGNSSGAYVLYYK